MPTIRRTASRDGLVSVLGEQHALVLVLKADAGDAWHENDLVFPSRSGTVADAANVRRSFRKVTALAGLDPTAWTPRELRHSFVSLMSDAGVPIERISQLVGHSVRQSPKPYTASRSGQSSPKALRSWTGSSPGIPQKRGRGPGMLSYSVGYSTERGHIAAGGDMASDLYHSVGVTGFEPATSSSRTAMLWAQKGILEAFAQIRPDEAG
jgi:hypothetical protein